MKNNIINIGEDFKRKKSIIDDYNNGYFTEFKNLNQCYTKASYSKQRVYNYYKELLQKNCDCVLNYGVRGHNCFTITLHAIIIKNNIKYYLLITPSYNYFIEI